MRSTDPFNTSRLPLSPAEEKTGRAGPPVNRQGAQPIRDPGAEKLLERPTGYKVAATWCLVHLEGSSGSSGGEESSAGDQGPSKETSKD